MNVLVTGGLGQIGSHVSEMLLARGDRVVVIDNLATGQRHHLADHPQLTVVIDTIANRDKVRELCAAHKFDAIVHTAAMWAGTMNEAQMQAADIAPNFVRMSVGVEHIDDLKADMARALQKL